MEQMISMPLLSKKKETTLIHTLVAFVFLMDEALLPVFHFAGIPFKVSYVFLLCSIVFFIFSIRLSNNLRFRFEANSEAKKVVALLGILIVLSCAGEITMTAFSGVRDAQPFWDAVLNFLFMMAAFILGYAICRYQKRILLWALYFYSGINIALLMFYGSLPGFIKSLYGEYYATGIRIRGTGGNANTTLLVMNMLLLSVVILYGLKKIKITGIHLWLVLLLPILTNVFISSRGEFVHTILLEVLYVFFVVKNEKNKMKTIARVAIIVFLLFAAYIYVFQHLYSTNAAIRYGIDRLSMIGEAAEVGEYDTGESDTLLRPFFRADVFWGRFQHSPVWGAGYSYGDAEGFIKSANGYHNDWFRVLASTGVLGLFCWFVMIKKFVKKAGLFVLLPFLIAGLTNTFLQSTHALNIYFFLFGTVIHLVEAETQNKKHNDEV